MARAYCSIDACAIASTHVVVNPHVHDYCGIVVCVYACTDACAYVDVITTTVDASTHTCASDGIAACAYVNTDAFPEAGTDPSGTTSSDACIYVGAYAGIVAYGSASIEVSIEASTDESAGEHAGTLARAHASTDTSTAVTSTALGQQAGPSQAWARPLGQQAGQPHERPVRPQHEGPRAQYRPSSHCLRLSPHGSFS